MTTKHLCALWSFILLLSVQCRGVATNAMEQIPQRLMSMTNQIHALAPTATFMLKTNRFQIQLGNLKQNKVEVPKDKAGEAQTKTRFITLVGPDANSFSVKVRWRKGAYHEALARRTVLVLDKTKERRVLDYYSSTALMELGSQGYVVTDVEFGENADTKLAAKLCSLIHAELL